MRYVNPFAASEWIIHDLLTTTGYASTISDSKLVVKATTSLRSGSATINVCLHDVRLRCGGNERIIALERPHQRVRPCRSIVSSM